MARKTRFEISRNVFLLESQCLEFFLEETRGGDWSGGTEYKQHALSTIRVADSSWAKISGNSTTTRCWGVWCCLQSKGRGNFKRICVKSCGLYKWIGYIGCRERNSNIKENFSPKHNLNHWIRWLRRNWRLMAHADFDRILFRRKLERPPHSSE